MTGDRNQNIRESIDSAVAAYCDDLGRDDDVTKGDGFAVWCLRTLFELSPDDAVDALTGGKNDRSLDAVADDGNRLVVLQAKYGSHSWAELTKFQTDMAAIERVAPDGSPEIVRAAAARIRRAKQNGQNVEYFYITSNDFSGDDSSRIGSLQAEPRVTALDLSGIDDLIRDKEAQRPLGIPPRPATIRAATDPLAFEGSIIFPVSLVEFARFVADGERWLFASNVRQYLAKSRVNQGIRTTVKGASEKFWRYNNGVTIVCDDFQNHSGQIQLMSPQVVNGCQTSLSIKKVVDEMDEEERKALRGSVLVRVIKETSDAERDEITQKTNRQNAVRGKDFFALNDFQRRLRARFEGNGYFYEIQTGSFDALSKSVKQKLTGDTRFTHLQWRGRDFRIPAIEAAKCHAAALRGKVAVCYANPGELAPNGDLYDTIFPSDLPEEPDLFLIPFLVLKHAEQALGYGAPRAEAYRRRGRYLFVYVTFRVLEHALRLAGKLDATERLAPEHLGILRETFQTQQLALDLVSLADTVIKSFFRDSATQKLVNDDIFAFLKGPVERLEATQILDTVIAFDLKERAGSDFVTELRRALP